MTALPANTPLPVRRTVAALTYQGYRVDRLHRHPSSPEPLLRLYMTGPRWFLLIIGLAWLVGYGLYRIPFTRKAGAALLRSRLTPAPIIYVDAAGVAH